MTSAPNQEAETPGAPRLVRVGYSTHRGPQTLAGHGASRLRISASTPPHCRNHWAGGVHVTFAKSAAAVRTAIMSSVTPRALARVRQSAALASNNA